MNTKEITPRREFLGKITAGAAAVAGFSAFSTEAFAANASLVPETFADAEDLFKKLSGKHRVVFDVTKPHELMPFVWPRVFLLTNEKTGTPEKDNSVVVILRHDAIPYAMDNPLWTKYNFAQVFKVDDPLTKQPATKNPFWQPKPGAYQVPGVGAVSIGINELQASGVKFCVCDMAMTVYSAAVAGMMNQDPAAVKKEWYAGLLPGIQPVPSGVWALGRAQEKGCAYIFAS